MGHPFLQNIITPLSFDPISLITLFFDSAEKDLVARSGDLNILSWFGLFVNPTTVWCEYGAMYPDQGLRYYLPDQMLTSTVEVAQVHDFLLRLARGRRNCGIVIKLKPSSQSSSWKASPWVWSVRPILPCVLLIMAGASLDFWAFGAIGCLLVGQTLGIARTRMDGWRQKRDSPNGHQEQATASADNKQAAASADTEHYTALADTEQKTAFFLANNVTIVVQSHGNLFKQAVSSIDCEKLEKPVVVEMLTILISMAGVLMVGFSNINFKVTYLIGHALQAVLIALANASKLNGCSVNGVTWQVEGDEEKLSRRRDAYIWVTMQMKSRQVNWLKELIHNPDSLVERISNELPEVAEKSQGTPGSLSYSADS